MGVSYSAPIQTTGAGPITYAVTTGALPDGLTLDANTGTVAGTPTTVGDSSFTVSATGPGGSVSLVYVMAVTAVPASTADPANSAELATTGPDPRGVLALSLAMITTGVATVLHSCRQTRVNDRRNLSRRRTGPRSNEDLPLETRQGAFGACV